MPYFSQEKEKIQSAVLNGTGKECAFHSKLSEIKRVSSEKIATYSSLALAELMGHSSSMFSGLTKSLSVRKWKNAGARDGEETVEAMAKEAKKNDLMLCNSGIINVYGSKNFASIFSKKGEKGMNQDCCIVWEVYIWTKKKKNP